MVVGVAPLIFPHQSPGRLDRYQSFHHHTRSHNNTHSKHIQMPRHHTGQALLATPGWAGMFGTELGGLGGTQAEAPSLLLLLLFVWWLLQWLLEGVVGWWWWWW